jgi:chromosome segregation ATPase
LQTSHAPAQIDVAIGRKIGEMVEGVSELESKIAMLYARYAAAHIDRDGWMRAIEFGEGRMTGIKGSNWLGGLSESRRQEISKLQAELDELRDKRHKAQSEMELVTAEINRLSERIEIARRQAIA